MRSTPIQLALGVCAALALSSSCDKNNGSTSNPADDNLVAAPSGGGGGGDDLDLGGGDSSELESGEEVKVEPWPAIAKPSKPVQKCKGKGKTKECAMVDPKPEISAAHGTRSMMGDYRWGMTPAQVFKLMSKDIELEHDDKQKATNDAMEQDRLRQWKAEQLQALKANHVKFTKASKHRWGVSLIQFDYQDDAQEEMLWVKSNSTLRKFYFFKDQELWKILYAYSNEAFPGKAYPEVVEEKFKRWFGPSPTPKLKVDPETQKILIAYNEWVSADASYVRSFDMSAVNGVLVLAVVDKNAEDRIGERLPNVGHDEAFSSDMQDVLGESDVCYDAEGGIRECPPEKK